MKSAEQWANEIQSALNARSTLEGISVSAERRLLEQSARAIQADALRHAAEMCFEKMKWHANPDFIEIYQAAGEMLKAEAAKLEEAQ